MARRAGRTGRRVGVGRAPVGPPVGLALLRFAAAAALIASAVGCGAGAGPRSVTVGAERPYVGDPPRIGAPSAERFGFEAAAGAVQPSTAPPAGAFDFDLPGGWEALAPTSMRALNLRVAREPRAECTLVLLGGDGGGLAANVNRWRGQLGLEALGEAQVELLPGGELLGRPATRVDLAGDYVGMGGAPAAGFRMLGLLAVAPEGSAFLKFVGPAAAIDAERGAFEALAASLRVRTAAPAPGAPTADEGSLAWTAPPGWTQGPRRVMRAVTFTTDPAGTVECYVAVLGGDGGGIRSNLDRWRAQMGAAPLTAAELAGLERIDALGTTAVLIEVAGGFEGMSGETVDDALLLGAVASLETRTVFVKLIGPRAAAAAERARFRAFVGSLERRP